LFERQRAHATYLIKDSFERQHEQLRRLGEGLVKASSGGTEKGTHYLAHLRMMLVQASQFHVRYGHEQLRLRQQQLRLESLELTNTELLLLKTSPRSCTTTAGAAPRATANCSNGWPPTCKQRFRWCSPSKGRPWPCTRPRVAQYDPVQMLKRGYSLTYANGQLLRSPAGLRPGTELTTRLENAVVVSKVVAVGEGDGRVETADGRH
jgi:exonuclease VII large subunit